MTNSVESFAQWIERQIVVKGKSDTFIIWCDPKGVWSDLLKSISNSNQILWIEEELHELALRAQFYHAEPKPQVVYLPVSKEAITYFQVFSIQATEVKQISLPQALSQYGVDIPAETLLELEEILPAYVKERLDQPKSAWKELTPGNAKEVLVSNELILETLANIGQDFEDLAQQDRFLVFARRVTEDLGLPTPKLKDADTWRSQALAHLLVTEAAELYPQNLPGEVDRIIPAGPQRDLALKLLSTWRKQIDSIDALESLTTSADKLTVLSGWAKSLDDIAAPVSSLAVEKVFFEKELQYIATLKEFDQAADFLASRQSTYTDHAQSFWGCRVKKPVGWSHLVQLAEAAQLFQKQAQVENAWKVPQEAIQWFTQVGWHVDRAGEQLFKEEWQLPEKLKPVREQLQKAYLRLVDKVNIAFSSLLSETSLDNLSLGYAGDAIAKTVKQASRQNPVAVIVLDACRYDIACRLSELLNQNEPVPRAEVSVAMAPVPSITAVGMPFCLPGDSQKIKVDLVPDSAGKQQWAVTVDGFPGNLADAAQRRAWLKQVYRLKDSCFLWIKDVIEGATDKPVTVRALGKLVFVFGDDLDDHDDKLKAFGLDMVIERYAATVRKLRAGGYGTIFVVTDHGFFRWEPAFDEKDFPKPSGNILKSSRRAIIGRNLEGSPAVPLKVTASDLDCFVPRSVNAFKTYGGLGFFHGGTTLQELVIPVLKAQWSTKAEKIGVVIKPLEQITSLTQRVEIAPAVVQQEVFGGVDANLTSREVMAKVIDPVTNKRLFKSPKVSIGPEDESMSLLLTQVDGAQSTFGATLDLQVIDADDEEILDHRTVTLRVELDDW